jgi:drug/metabolite transporter (DMT)-like permease
MLDAGRKAPPSALAHAVLTAAPAGFVLLWATGFIGAKLGLPYAEPMTFLGLRMVAIVVPLGLVMMLTPSAWPDRAGVAHSAITGVLVHGGYLGGVYLAIYCGMPAGISSLVVGLQPILTSTLANRWLGEHVRPRQWFGLLLGIAGVYLVVRDGRAVNGASPLAWAAILTALVTMTIGTLYQKRHGGNIDWRSGLTIQYLAAGVVFAIGAFGFETRHVEFSLVFVLTLAWLSYVMSFGAIWLLYSLIRSNAATRVVSLFYLTPPVTAVMAWLLFDESLAPLAIAGMAVCVAGVVLVNWRTA